MGDYADYPAIELSFDASGKPDVGNFPADLVKFVTTGPAAHATDLFVFSHGWNNTKAEAHDELYLPFFKELRLLMQDGRVPFRGRMPAVAAVYWPSKRFVPPASRQGLELGDPVADRLNAQLDAIAELFPDPDGLAATQNARDEIGNLDDGAAQDRFVAAIIKLAPADGFADEGLDDAIASVRSAQISGQDTLAAVRRATSAHASPPLPSDDLQEGGGLGLFSGITSAADSFLNIFTYYTMKQRAGVIGVTGLAPLLEAVMAARAVRIHLIGHSFGGRLVTAAASGLGHGIAVRSMSLLQAAYSHYGMAKNWDGGGADGAFRSVIGGKKVSDFILVTHSVHDSAVGRWYPIASEIMKQAASAVRAVSRWGGMGADGAQATPETTDDTLLATGTPYADFPAGKWVRNLNGDGPDPQIHEHGDVVKEEIVAALMRHIDRYSH